MSEPKIGICRVPALPSLRGSSDCFPLRDHIDHVSTVAMDSQTAEGASIIPASGLTQANW